MVSDHDLHEYEYKYKTHVLNCWCVESCTNIHVCTPSIWCILCLDYVFFLFKKLRYWIFFLHSCSDTLIVVCHTDSISKYDNISKIHTHTHAHTRACARIGLLPDQANKQRIKQDNSESTENSTLNSELLPFTDEYSYFFRNVCISLLRDKCFFITT